MSQRNLAVGIGSKEGVVFEVVHHLSKFGCAREGELLHSLGQLRTVKAPLDLSLADSSPSDYSIEPLSALYLKQIQQQGFLRVGLVQRYS